MSTRTYEYQTDFVRRYVSEGEANVLLMVLEARGIDVPADVRARVIECTEPAQIEAWARRAATADSVADIFG